MGEPRAPELGERGAGPGGRGGRRSREEGSADRGPGPRPRSRPAGGGGGPGGGRPEPDQTAEGPARGAGRSEGGGSPGGGWRGKGEVRVRPARPGAGTAAQGRYQPEPRDVFSVLRAEAGDAGSGALRRLRSPGRDSAGPRIPFALLAVCRRDEWRRRRFSRSCKGSRTRGPWTFIGQPTCVQFFLLLLLFLM